MALYPKNNKNELCYEKVDEIKKKLAELGLSLHGNKAELKKRLMDHLYGEDTGDAEESEVEHTVELPDMTAQVAQTERKRGQRGLNRKYAFVSKHATLEEGRAAVAAMNTWTTGCFRDYKTIGQTQFYDCKFKNRSGCSAKLSLYYCETSTEVTIC